MQLIILEACMLYGLRSWGYSIKYICKGGIEWWSINCVKMGKEGMRGPAVAYITYNAMLPKG